MAVPTLASEEYQYMDTGIKLNSSPAMPFVDITRVDGLDNAPVRQSTTPREGTHGGFVDAEFEDIRTITLEGTIYASNTALETYLDTLKANFAPTATANPLYLGVDVAPSPRMIFAKCLGLRYTKESQRRIGAIEFQTQFICEDPRIYDTAVISQALPGTLTLGGNRSTTGTITITDKVNPTITIGTTTFTFALTIAAGHNVVIDLDKRTVILDGTTNVRGNMTLTGKWPKLQPGPNVFTTGGTGAGTITVAARSAWR